MTPLSREQVREVDRRAIQELGIPGVVLMENAGLNALAAIDRFMQGRLGTDRKASTAIFCGGGNNGGDGYVIARHLHNRGDAVTIYACKPIEQLTGDASVMAGICQKMGMDIQPVSRLTTQASSLTSSPAVIIDALLGTGFQGSLREDMRNLIDTIKDARNTPGPDRPVIVAIDLPSGLNCDTGQPPEGPPDHPGQTAIRADLTVTFVAEKLGFSKPTAKRYLGQVEVASIGVPPELIRRVSGQ